jgi:Mn2+/Fe2+ NRAMP family transporter
MITVSRSVTTVLALIAIAMLYFLLGRYPERFTTIIGGFLLVCGLVLLFIVNAHVVKKSNKRSFEETRNEPRENGNER